MRIHKISKQKQNGMRRQFINGTFSSHKAAAEFGISTCTAWRYERLLKRIQAERPEKLGDMNFYIPDPEKPHQATALYVQLCPVLPPLLAEETTAILNPKNVWRSYRKLYPGGYCYTTFRDNLERWVSENVTAIPHKLLYQLPDADLKTLKAWRLGNNHRNWQIATTLIMALDGATVMQIMAKVESSRKTVNLWLAIYRRKGLPGFDLPKPSTPKEVVERMKTRKACLFKLIQESPKMHGIHRTSWTITALTSVYNRLYQRNNTIMSIASCLQQMGYRYQKSRDILTSQDPLFRQKVDHIQKILRNLKPDEKFCSIDEYGPVYVRLKHGSMLQHKSEPPRGVPEKQKSRGKVICTAALELSTNQVTHFFSERKNTFEMIKLLDLLTAKYHDQKRLYICWDAVSWHRSGILKTYIHDHNQNHKPEIKLAPLPSCTQYLNVIESVFAGLARAVIHNSDYPSVSDCQAAISLHFTIRNQHFLQHPKRAGKKIWGKEIVAPRFSETHHCRKISAMKGARLTND